jgi:hypothetical protein
MTRRFPQPRTVHSNDSSYWVEGANGGRVRFCYFRDRELVATGMDAFMARDEARRIASNIAKLPDLLKS